MFPTVQQSSYCVKTNLMQETIGEDKMEEEWRFGDSLVTSSVLFPFRNLIQRILSPQNLQFPFLKGTNSFIYKIDPQLTKTIYFGPHHSASQSKINRSLSCHNNFAGVGGSVDTLQPEVSFSATGPFIVASIWPCDLPLWVFLPLPISGEGCSFSM